MENGIIHGNNSEIKHQSQCENIIKKNDTTKHDVN